MIAFAIALSGCDDDGMCLLHVERSISVEVYDAVTGEPAAAGSRGFIRDGSFTDTLDMAAFRADGRQIGLAGGWERPGIYDVHIENPAYVPWDTSGVVVKSGPCHVRPARITARLTPR